MKTSPFQLRFAAAILLSAASSLAAESLQLSVTLPSSSNETNRQALLEWSAATAGTYLVQSAGELSPGTIWKTEEAVQASKAGPLKWMAPEALSERRFYRLILPQTELFTLEPAFVNSDNPGALLYITGQLLPADCTIVINGQNFTPTQVASDGTWAAISLNGLPPGTPITGNVLLLNSSSNIVATLPLQSPVVYGTEWTPEQIQGPAEEPPASPETFIVEELEFVVEKVERARIANYGHVTVLKAYATDPYVETAQRYATDPYVETSERYATDPYVETTQRAYLSKKGYDYYKSSARCGAAASVSLSTGELQYESTDLALEGRGPGFGWVRFYRSRSQQTTALGPGWDFSYNVSLSQQPDGTVVLRPGNGRADTFYPDGTNGWTRDEYFVEVRDLNSDGMPDVLFADTGKWLFKPSGLPEAGKLWKIVDRNGNTITLNYDIAGRLTSIVDTLNRTNTVAYNPVGQIESVMDFSGRTVRYEYDTAGNLAASISPPVTGTPNGNDFPGGKTNRFLYTSGNTDARLNHNLLSVIDPKGQTCLEVAYQGTSDPESIDFDAVSSVLRGIDKKDIRRGMIIVKPGSYATVQAIVNDYIGNVTEYLFDSRHRCVSQRDFTGRADPALPTTATENRPTGKLRGDDPDYFETIWQWNADSLCTREIRSDGSSTEISHQRWQDHNSSRSNKTASRRHDGDVRVLRERAGTVIDSDGDGAPDTSELTWHFEYDPRFGSPASSKGKKLYVGNLPFSSRDVASRKGWDGTIKGSGGSARVITDRDTGRSKGFGFVERVIDPRGTVMTYEHDNSGNCTKSIKQGHYAVSNFHIEVDAAYNSNGQVTAITNAPDALGNRRVDIISYYTSGPQLSMVEVMMAVGVSGGLSLATTYEYDPRGNVTRVVDPLGNDSLYTYNALDQCVQSETPFYGGGGGLPSQRVRTKYFYDANDNLAQCDVENRDETGALSSANPLWTTLLEYDSRDRLAGIVGEASEGGGLPGSYVTNRYVYAADDTLTETRSPLAVSGADPHNVVAYQYDERGLLYRVVAAPGSPSQSTTQYDYDHNGNMTRLSRGLEEGASVTTFQYEALKYVGGGGKAQGAMGQKAKAWMVNNYEVHPVSGLKSLKWVETVWNKQCVEKDTTVRLSQVTDPMGNVTTFHYDGNSNLRVIRHYGETNDVPGSAGNLLLSETRFKYDSFDRCVEQANSFFDVLTGASIGDGKATSAFTYAPNGACITSADDSGRTTRYSYDAVGRLSSVTDPKANVAQYTYDGCDNLISTVATERSDLGGPPQQFSVLQSFDALGRCITSTDNVGNTNRYAYDSRGNLVSHLDPRGNEALSIYDGLGRCVTNINFVGADRTITINTSHVEYDVNSRQTAFMDSNGNATTYTYDSLNRCVAVTQADGTSTALVWSPRSNLLTVEDANGTTITNTYDHRERVIHRDIAARGAALPTTTFEMFAYDGSSRCVAASNDTSLVTLRYDSLGNCVQTTQDGLTCSASFDGAGNRLSLSYPSGRLVTYGYDALNQVTNVSSSPGGGLPLVTLGTYSYEGPGRVGRIFRANSIASRIQWSGLINPANAAGDFGWQQVSVINHQAAGGGPVVDRRLFRYDRNQNRLSRHQITPFYTGGSNRTNEFGYDALNRLNEALDSILGLIRVYDLDANGNRLTVSSNGVPEAYTMDNTFPDPADFQVNQYTVTPFGSQTWDPNGNLLSRVSAAGPVFYHYDYANRLVHVEALGGSGVLEPVASFGYDALGRRISKTTYPPAPLTPETLQYVYGDGGDCDDKDEGIIEVRSGGIVTATHVGLCSPVAGAGPPLVSFAASGEARWLHADDLGNVLALTDAAGAVIERYDYDEFGQPSFLNTDGFPTSATASAFGNVFLFRGAEWDAETGLYYFGASPHRNSNPLYKDNGLSGENPLYQGHHYDAKVAQSIGLPKITPKIAKEHHGKFRLMLNPWSQGADEGGATFGTRSRGMGGGGGGSGGSLVFFNDASVTVRLIVPVAMDKGLRVAKEEGGRHTPFHNKYRPHFRKILDYGEAGDNVGILLRASRCPCKYCSGVKGHVTLIR